MSVRRDRGGRAAVVGQAPQGPRGGRGGRGRRLARRP